MTVTIDGQSLFDMHASKIEAGSFRRDSIERAAAGLDGMMTIDLGSRGRKIKQTGTLRAKSNSHINERIAAINAFMDGDTHTLITDDGTTLKNLRMDSFKVTNERADGAGIVVDYEIIYTQLT